MKGSEEYKCSAQPSLHLRGSFVQEIFPPPLLEWSQPSNSIHARIPFYISDIIYSPVNSLLEG